MVTKGQQHQHRDLRAELIKDLEQIEDNAFLYHRGRNSAYQTVALQLRNLLLGGRRGLLVRVISDAKLEPFLDPPDHHAPASRRRVTIFGRAQWYPGWNGERDRIGVDVDGDGEPVSVERWLDQWILRPDVSVRELIRNTADEEVAHTQQLRGELLAKLAGAGVRFVSKADLDAGRPDNGELAQEMYQMTIVGIGEYVARRARALVAMN